MTRENLLKRIVECLGVERGPDDRGEYVAWCPFHPDGKGKPPHQANLNFSERGFICHACGAKGSLFELARKLGMEDTAREKPEETYDYRDEQGELLFQVVRFPRKRFSQRRPDGNGGWIWSLNGIRRVLYRLPEIIARADDLVFVCEGEKDADALSSLGLVATTNPGGAGKWRPEYSEMLKGREVVIVPDNDGPGRSHADQIARSLAGIARTIKTVGLPGLPEKGDVTDWLAAGRTVDELLSLAEETPLWQPRDMPSEPEATANHESEPQRSQADRLVALVIESGAELFHDSLGDAFARVPVSEHEEVWRCRSKNFKRWLAGLFWQRHEKAVNSDTLSSALNVIEAKSRFEGKEYALYNRVALHEGAIWYDLTDPEWRAVRVTPDGWEIVDNPPTLFRRYAHQRPQVEPVRGGNLKDFLHSVNLRHPGDELLLLIYVVSCLVPDIPHPIPVLHGPQGSAKTTLFCMIRRLIDPSATEVLSFPRDAVQLVQQLSHHWMPFYDNITSIPDWLSDTLCRSVTGEGFSKRELYTDDDDVIYQFRRCVGLNGINVAAQKSDLLDRSIVLGLEAITPETRKPEQQLWADFERARPLLFGAMLTALSRAMASRSQIKLSGLPRMADFALYGCAIARGLGCQQDDFLAAFDENIRIRNDEVLASSPVAGMIVALMEQQNDWEDSPSELLAELNHLAEEHHIDKKARAWPKLPHILTRRLNEIRPNLAAAGITIATGGRSAQHRKVSIRKTPRNSVISVTSVTDPRSEEGPSASDDDAANDATAADPQIASPSPAVIQAQHDADDASDATLRHDKESASPERPEQVEVMPADHNCRNVLLTALSTQGYAPLQSAALGGETVIVLRDESVIVPERWKQAVSYTVGELEQLRGLPIGALRQVHDLKVVFGGRVVEQATGE